MKRFGCLHRPLKLLVCFSLSLLLALGQSSLWLPGVVANTPLSQSEYRQDTLPLLTQGRSLYEMGQYAEAVTAWEQAAQSFADRGDYLSQASALSNLALAYQATGEIESSEEAISQSLTLINRLTPTSKTASTFAQVWNNQGNLLLMRSQPTPALEAFQAAIAHYQQANDTEGTLRSQINQARSLQSLGFYRRALLQLTDLTPPLDAQPDSPTKLSGLQLLGDLYRSVGDLSTAEATLEAGLILSRTLEPQSSTVPLLVSLGHTAQANSETEQALSYYQEAADSTTNPYVKLSAQLSQLSLLSSVGNDDSATASALLTADIKSAIDRLPVDRASLNARLALVRQQLSGSSRDISPETIAQNLVTAQQQAAELNDLSAESYALGYLGELYAQQQQIIEAQTALKRALDLAQSLSSPELAYQWNWQLGLIDRQQGDRETAIAHYQSAVDNLELLKGNLVAIAPDLRFDFTEKVEPVYRDLVDLLLRDAHSDTDSIERQNDSAKTQFNLSAARDTIESLQLAELENYFQEPCVPVSQQIDQIIDSAESPTAVVYPIILPDRGETILKLPNQPLQQYTTNVSQPELEALLTTLQRDLRLPYTLNSVQTASAQLYDWLIRPTKNTLDASQVDTLVFVLDGFLRSIPMAVLYDGQHYLVEDYSIALAPGLQLVDPRALNNQQLATVIAGLSESPHDGFSALPFVKNEVEQVQQTTPSRVLLNESFTQANLETAINSTDFPLVHLATHGQFSDDPNETFILAWDKRIQVNALSQLLRQGERTRQASIELLILSACETAVGDKRAALGLAGIALQAGARSTLASLWNLDDASSALFSNYFYQALLEPNMSKAQALRQAQLKILGDSNADPAVYQHPLYWAPYILLGSWL